MGDSRLGSCAQWRRWGRRGQRLDPRVAVIGARLHGDDARCVIQGVRVLRQPRVVREGGLRAWGVDCAGGCCTSAARRADYAGRAGCPRCAGIGKLAHAEHAASC